MNATSNPSARRVARHAAAGFTLVELMVALLLSLLLAVAVLKMQTKMASQTMRVADTGTRDTQTRAAMDLITRDLSSAGFLLGDLSHSCPAVLTYDSGTATGYFAHHAVDSLVATSSSKMAFAPSLTLNYPAGTSSMVASDVLVVMGTTAATQFNNVLPNAAAVAGNPLVTGVVKMSKTNGFVKGDAAIMQLLLGNDLPCVRVPVSDFTANSSMTSTGGTIMPSASYNGFVTPLATAGFSTALTNTGIYTSKVVDIGTATTTTQLFTVYYVDGSGSFPVLMRAQYSLADDSVVTAPQPIAAGVVSLRVSYGVDPTGAGSATAYEEAAQVTTNKHWSVVRSVRVALVARTINDDPVADTTTTYAAPTSIAIPASAPVSGAWFASISVPASHHHYTVNTTEVAYRNWLWKY